MYKIWSSNSEHYKKNYIYIYIHENNISPKKNIREKQTQI